MNDILLTPPTTAHTNFTTSFVSTTRPYLHPEIAIKPGCFGSPKDKYVNNIKLPIYLGELSTAIKAYLFPFQMKGDSAFASPRSNAGQSGFEVLETINSFVSFLPYLRNYANVDGKCTPVYEYGDWSKGVVSVNFVESCQAKVDVASTIFSNVLIAPKRNSEKFDFQFCTSSDEAIVLSERSGPSPVSLRKCADEKPIQGFFLGLSCPTIADCFQNPAPHKLKVLKEPLQELASVHIQKYLLEKCDNSSNYYPETTDEPQLSGSMQAKAFALTTFVTALLGL
ncbi:MAG: hypothetical protein S4CHLAM6_15200 [Chlamydiae bacterium]|nr:hypothetical protein [Chlamydiota bacterium]